MTDFQTVKYRTDKRVAWISLDRQEALNAFNTRLRLDLLAAIERANGDDDARVVALTGEGRSFSTGHDLASGFGDHDTAAGALRHEYKPIMEAIGDSDKLCIAVVNGVAAGIGAALALSCDLSVMADDAYMFFAFAAIGVVVDGGTSFHLVRRLGYSKAVEIVMEAEKIPAKECLALGLVNKVVPASELDFRARQWAQELAEGSPLAQKYNKQLLRAAMQRDWNTMFAMEAEKQNIVTASEDFERAKAAFFNKEKPKFSGR